MIIGVLNQKGGVGKTTIAVNIAAVLVEVGQRVLLVDADPQGSALAWSSARERDPLFPVVGLPKPTLHRDLPRLAIDYGFVLIDGAAANAELARSAMLACDIVLIPVQPSAYDVWGTSQTAQLVKEAQQLKETLTAAFVVNRKTVDAALGRDILQALERFDLPILAAHLGQRLVYAESASQGLAVVEAGQHSKAACEIAALISALLRIVHAPRQPPEALAAA